MLENLLSALALMLIIEGILPFLFPDKWRQTFIKLVQMEDGQIRFFGLTAMIIGLVLLLIITGN